MSDPKSISVYAGTFDPITNGHLDIVKRAAKVFGQVIIAVSENPSKNTLLSASDRLSLVEQSVAGVEGEVVVQGFSGLLVDFVRDSSASVIVRGLRAVSDYEYEAQMAITNRQLANEIETVFLVTSPSCSFISSSIVKEVAKNGGCVSEMVPEVVAKQLQSAFTTS